MNVQDKFTATRQELSTSLIERSQEVDLVLTALLSGEHCLLVGPPGTAKSTLADALVGWIAGQKFSILMNRFTTPEEVFGPVSIAALKADEYRRITDHMLPEADVAFLDEIFKSSSAILNTTLKILNERQFTNGKAVLACPLKLCVAASNEWPTEAKELGALFDRFLFRKLVDPVGGEDGVERLMFAADLTPSLSTSLSLSELKSAQVDVSGVTWEDEAKEAAAEIRRKVTREGIVIGDRRLRKSVVAAQAYAWLGGGATVTTDDLEILSHVWWASPEGQPQIVADAVADIARPAGLLAAQLLGEANQIVKDCDVKDLANAAVAAKKVGKIAKDLKRMSGPRAEEACKRVEQMVSEIRLATVAAIG